MAWIMLVLAGLFETAFAVALKQSNGFTRPLPTVLFVGFALISFGLLALALRSLPVGTAYAVWTGIGAAGTVLVGIGFLGESTELARLVSITLIVAGVVGLRVFSG